LSTADFF
jgi:hypothetical protein